MRDKQGRKKKKKKKIVRIMVVNLISDVLPEMFPFFLHLFVFDSSFFFCLLDGLLPQLLLLNVPLLVAVIVAAAASNRWKLA